METEKISIKFGHVTSLTLSALTLLTFIIAFLTPPLSGPFCQADCYEYPYLDIASRYPRDYIWMFPAMLMLLTFVAFVSSIHQNTDIRKKVFSLTGLCFGIIAAVILLTNYFLQVTVIQSSLVKAETDGIPILTQFNDHGIFIALEEIGYILMSVSFLFLGFGFSNQVKLERFIKWIFIVAFILTVVSLAYFSLAMGIDRSYLFEVTVITIVFLTLIVTGILVGILFNKKLKAIT